MVQSITDQPTHLIQVTNLRARDLAQVHRLKDHGRRREHTRVHDTPGRRHDLTHTTVDGICVKHNIQQVEPAATNL